MSINHEDEIMNRYYVLIMLMSLTSGFAPEGITQQLRHLPETLMDIQTPFKESAVPATDSLIQSLIDQTNLDTLIHFVNILSGEDSVTINDSTYLLLSRNVFHPHNDLAADFIFQTLTRFGLPTYNQNYTVVGRNVYAVQTGTDYPDQKFIICAHYDALPIQSPAPGADDNASGTAAVLEAARILSQIQTPYTIVYALWDEEETGHFGSNYYAQQTSQSGDDILGVINVDMLGWDGNDDGLINIHSSPIAHSVELATLIKDLNNYYQIGLLPHVYSVVKSISDHNSFWNKGYSAVLLIEAYFGGDVSPFYHTSNDKIVHFNLDYFHALSKLAVAAISQLSFYNLPTRVEDQENTSLSDFILNQNYPNPFSASGIFDNSSTTIEFALPEPAFVTLKIYDLLGREVATVVADKLAVGKYQYNWHAMGMAAGVYFYKIEAGSFTMTRKMLLIQ